MIINLLDTENCKMVILETSEEITDIRDYIMNRCRDTTIIMESL